MLPAIGPDSEVSMNECIISIQLEQFIQYRRSAGFEDKSTNAFLKGFVSHLESIGYRGHLSWEIVKDYCEIRPDSDSRSRGRRFECFLSFSKYVNAIDPESEILPILPYGRCHTRPRPHIYSEQEIRLLVEACGSLYSPDGLRALTMKTVIGLMASTGLRTSEAVNLRIRDLDLSKKTITVINGKNGRDRTLPVLDSVLRELGAYISATEGILGNSRHPMDQLFVTTGGKPTTVRGLDYAFSLIRDCIDTSDSDYPKAILYHLRHTFATRTVERWQKEGKVPGNMLYYLSVYMGHVHPEDTYWYLSLTPGIIANASSRCEMLFGGEL